MKVVLAYSGGLDTSVLVRWIKDRFNAEVITFAADVGQEEELNGLAEKAKATGASAHYTVDLQEEFARDFIFPMIRANALYEGQYYLGTSIARPLIAKAHVEVARAENATHLAHGATGKGNDQCRFEISYAALAPDLQAIAPWRMEGFRKAFPGRSEMIEYCRKNGINVLASAKKPYSMDRNMLHISYEAGILEDPWFDPTVPENKDMFKLTSDPVDAPNEPEYIELDFENGDCVAINGEKMTPAQIMKKLNALAGKHGIGRLDMVENRFVGMKSRGVYETPGGTMLYAAHGILESITLDRATSHYKELVASKFAEQVYDGMWYTPLREALSAFVDSTQQAVNGTVKLKLYKGNCINAGVKSPNSLYMEEIATFGDSHDLYSHKDSAGFINLLGLPLKVKAMVEQKNKK